MPTLNWIGKAAVLDHHRAVPTRMLECDAELSCGDPHADNLLIEGDNLEALKALLPRFRAQVKCVYIDPPYNTGKEGWRYNDNVNDPRIKKWLGDVVGKEAEDLCRHDKWLCMMFPRLMLLRELMREDGVIIIHIDEHELASLTALLDEIFGRENALGQIVWDKGNPKGDSSGISFQHESLLVYTRNKKVFDASYGPPMVAKPNAAAMLNKAASLLGGVGREKLPDDFAAFAQQFNLPEEACAPYRKLYDLADAQQEFQRWVKTEPGLTGGERQYFRIRHDDVAGKHRVYRLASMAWPNKKRAPDEYFQPLVHPATGEFCPIPVRGWRYPPATMQRLLQEGKIEFGADHSVQPQQRLYLDEYLQQRLSSVIRDARSDDRLFRELGLEFENPKPHGFVQNIIEAFTKPGELILDSFAGSGTTGHAVIATNRAGETARRFILIELDPDICESVTAKRLAHVVETSSTQTGDDTALPTDALGFRYLRLGQTIGD